ncbi:MAG: hypothetical protein U5L11_14175 [Arhodomonas sp.]|nr:hypothetical protein [Arhodomonas sp.]
MLHRILIALTLMLFAGGALAYSCPGHMNAIDQALNSGEHVELSEAEMEKVRELRAAGERQHEAGEHGKSVQTLKEARALLGIAE